MTFKKKVSFLLPMLAAVLVAVLFSMVTHPGPGFAAAMFLPMMPRVMGRRLLNRDIALNQGTFGLGGEELSYPVYDRMKMSNAQATNNRILFKTAVGAQREGVTLTYADTNITQSEQVPTSQKWVFDSLTLQYLGAAARTDALLQSALDYMRTTSFALQINSKDSMFVLPLWFFFGSPQVVSAPAATINSRFPGAIFTGVWEFSDCPIVLQSNTNWGLVISPLTASAAGLDGDYIAFTFKGKRARAD